MILMLGNHYQDDRVVHLTHCTNKSTTQIILDTLESVEKEH